ncbi:ParB/RepB/Spo0J family partition protein [Bifidobacterium boum]|uniref:ParB/RepB/Spo0J family partition protein n=1 Tax=Bifidobacterium boum TaxID=78343 RepID=UPI00242F3310|nr:ParB/RepB/Spo0J family partition protein [Bifidobacterium boum]MCI5861986.1 ParB/RepB/Spo0J family partition protein [Bifidobacterium boum]
MDTDNDVRSWLKDNFGHDFGTEGFVMPQNAAGVWLVGPKALGPMWSETCLMNYLQLYLETVFNISLMNSIAIHGVMKPIIIDGTKTGRVRKFEIVDGYHRLIAASVLGLKTPVCLIDMSAKGKKPSKRLVKDFLAAVYSKEDTQ